MCTFLKIKIEVLMLSEMPVNLFMFINTIMCPCDPISHQTGPLLPRIHSKLV